MGVLERLGVRAVVNAHDCITRLSGSVPDPQVVQAMAEAAGQSVVMEELVAAANERLAELSQNQAALVTNGAAAGLAVAVAACITGTDLSEIALLPEPRSTRREVVIHRAQRHQYDQAIRLAGGKLVEIGNVEGTADWELQSALTENTACVVYFAAPSFGRGALPLHDVLSIAHERNVPVVVDAAAQIPPVENLWAFTQSGADLVVFSGSKGIRGPQASGLIVGSKDLVEACRLNYSPNASIGRTMKVGKESIAGLVVAVERLVQADNSQWFQEQEDRVAFLAREIQHPLVTVERLFPGPAGQPYPRALIRFAPDTISASEFQDCLDSGDPRVIVGISETQDAIVVNPTTLKSGEVEIVAQMIQLTLAPKELRRA